MAITQELPANNPITDANGEQIIYTSDAGEVTQESYRNEDHEGFHVSLKADTLTSVGPLPITNSLVSSVLGSIVLVVLLVLATRKLSTVPGKGQSLLELGIEKGYDFTKGILESESVARKTFPLIASLFVFILFFNLIKFVPGYESLNFDGIHVFKPIHGDLNMTLALGITAFIFIQMSGILVLGFWKYGSKFINIKKPLTIPIGLIELVAEIAKLFSLSLRLFINIFVGSVLLLLVGALSHFVLPVPVMLFEVFIAFLQAGIFSLLTLMYVKLAIDEPH